MMIFSRELLTLTTKKDFGCMHSTEWAAAGCVPETITRKKKRENGGKKYGTVVRSLIPHKLEHLRYGAARK